MLFLSIVLFVITLIMLIVTLIQSFKTAEKVSKLVDKKYIEILKPMLSIGDVIALDIYDEDGLHEIGIVTNISGDEICYIGADGKEYLHYIKKISKIYCSEEISKRVKDNVIRNFEETLENAIINSK